MRKRKSPLCPLCLCGEYATDVLWQPWHSACGALWRQAPRSRAAPE